MSSILTAAIRSNVAIVALYGIIGIEILQVLCFGISKLRCSFDEGVLCTTASVCTLRDVDGTVETVPILVAFAVVGLEL